MSTQSTIFDLGGHGPSPRKLNFYDGDEISSRVDLSEIQHDRVSEERKNALDPTIPEIVKALFGLLLYDLALLHSYDIYINSILN